MATQRKVIWTRAARDLLFETVVAKFGPYSTWKKAGSPGGGQDSAFDDFCQTFASTIGANSADAVKHQIAWGTPTPFGGVHDWTNQGHAAVAILNLAAALDAGFIRSKDLPKLLAEGRYERNKA
jgi:hypothetical protein